MEAYLASNDTAPDLPFLAVGRSDHGRLSLDGRQIARREAGQRPGAGRILAVAILLDSSAILAAADQSDLNHRAALAWFGRADEPLLVGALTLGEADLLLQRELGLRASAGPARRRGQRAGCGSWRRLRRIWPGPRS